MPEFRVAWEIDIDADSPEEAARKALETQRDPDSIATVFAVFSPKQGRIGREHLGDFDLSGLGADLPAKGRILPRVEILHERDPDSSCDVSLYLDGRLITYKDTSYVEESVDPGAGGSLSDWNEHIAVLEADEGLSEAFRTAAVEANNRGAESPYLDDDEDDEFTLADEPEEPEDIDDGLFDELVTDDLPEDTDA